MALKTIEGSILHKGPSIFHSDPAFSCMTDALATGTLLHHYRRASTGAGGVFMLLYCLTPRQVTGILHTHGCHVWCQTKHRSLDGAHALHACRHRSRSASVPRNRGRISPERPSRRPDKDRHGRDRSPSPHRQAHPVAAWERCAARSGVLSAHTGFQSWHLAMGIAAVSKRSVLRPHVRIYSPPSTGLLSPTDAG